TVLLYSCQGGQQGDPPSGIEGTGLNGTQPPPAPQIKAIYPDCVAQSQTGTGSVQIDGQSFLPGAVARWNGVDRPTTYVTAGQLSVQLEPGDYASVGTGLISVSNPGPGGGSSNNLVFTISAGGVGPNSITIDPSGTFAYVASQGCSANSNGSISMY